MEQVKKAVMKTRGIVTVATGLILLALAPIMQAQALKGIVAPYGASLSPSTQSSSSDSSGDGFSGMRSFRNDSFLTVQLKLNNLEKENSETKLTPVLRVLSDEYDYSHKELEKYKNESFVKVYVESLNKELESDPFYHVGREIKTGSFFYEEKSWDALADTLRKKYKVVRLADKAAKNVEKSVTFSYDSADGSSVKMRPGIDRIDGSSIAVARLSIRDFAGIENIETRIGEDSMKIRFSQLLSRVLLALEYESSRESDESGATRWNNVSQLVMEIPFW